MNHSFKTIWSATRERFIPVSEVTRGARPSKGRAKKAISALMLSVMASGAMAETAVINGETFNVVTEVVNPRITFGKKPLGVIKDDGSVELYPANTIYLNSKFVTTEVFAGILNVGTSPTSHPSLGAGSLDGFREVHVHDGKTVVLAGRTDGPTDVNLFENSLRMLAIYENVESEGQGSFIQLGWAEGPRRHGDIRYLDIQNQGSGAMLNGDFGIRERITLGSDKLQKRGGTLTIGNGASIKAMLLTIWPEAELNVDDGVFELVMHNGRGKNHLYGRITIGEKGSFITGTAPLRAPLRDILDYMTDTDAHLSTIHNKGSLTFTQPTLLNGKLTNEGTMTVDEATIKGDYVVFTNTKTFTGKALTVEASNVSSVTPAPDTTFVNQGDVIFDNLTFSGGNLRFEGGTVHPAAQHLNLPSGTLEIGKDSGAMVGTFYLGNLQGTMDANLVVKEKGTLVVADALTNTSGSQLHFAQALKLNAPGTLSVMNTTPVTAGNAHIGAGSVTSIDFAAIASKTNPVLLTTGGGTLTVDAGAKLKLVNVTNVNAAQEERYQITKDFTLPGLDATNAWSGGWTQITDDNKAVDFELTWKDNPADAESGTLEANALYVLMKPHVGGDDDDAATDDFTDNAVGVDAIVNVTRSSSSSFGSRSGSLWRTDDANMGRTLWVEGIGETVNAGHQQAYKYHRAGLVMGADRRIGAENQALIGLAGSVSHATGETTREAATSDLKLNALGLYAYGAYRHQDSLLNAHVGYVYQTNRLTHEDQKAKVNLHMVSAAANLSHRFNVNDRVVVKPHVGLAAGWLFGSDYDIRQNGTVVDSKHSKSRFLMDLPVGVSIEMAPYALKGWTMSPMADVTLTKPLGQKHVVATSQTGAQTVRELSGAMTSWTLGFEAKKATWEVNTRYRFTHGAHHHREHALDVRVVKAF